jgi:16S rRNA processing protein RimM
MRLDDCFQLGKVTKPHGLKGEVSVWLDTDSPENYEEMESVFVLTGNKLVPFFIEYLDLNKDRAIVKFEGIDDQSSALSLKNAELYLPLSILPERENNAFYFHEIIGHLVKDCNHGDVGIVESVYTAGAQDLLAVRHKKGEVLIPIHDDIIEQVDRSNKCIHVCLPAGLLELYLEENAD